MEEIVKTKVSETKEIEQTNLKDSENPNNETDFKKEEGNQFDQFNKKRPWKNFRKQRRICYFCAAGIYYIDYKDQELLSKYINSYCKIMPRRQTRCCNKHQGYLANAIKRARIVGLLPFIKVE